MARKQRKKKDTADAVIEEFESIAERLAGWVGEHPFWVGGFVALSLGLAAAYGGYDSWHTHREQDASAALDRVRSEYLKAMGAVPGALEVPELANPDTAQRIKREFVAQFAQVATERRGTVAGTLAALEQGNLMEETEEEWDSAIEIWTGALEGAPRNGRLRAIVWERIAQAQEEAGRWIEAAEAHEQAGRISSFPLRYRALADAARCYAAGDQLERAGALFDRLTHEAPALRLPEHIRSQRRELATLGSL